MTNKEIRNRVVTPPFVQGKLTTPINKQAQPKPTQIVDKKASLRDQFGYGLEILNHKFGEMLLRDGGCTMGEVRKAEWNTKSITFYNAFNALEKKGLVEKQDGRMRAVVPPKQGGK